MKRLTYILLITCMTTVTGCVVPWPSSTPVAPKLTGTVLDASSGKPIATAHIEHRYNEKTFVTTKTKADGSFATPELSQKHWGYMFGIALNYPLPYWDPFPGQPRSTLVRVWATGYEPTTRPFSFDPDYGKAMASPEPFTVELQPLEEGR